VFAAEAEVEWSFKEAEDDAFGAERNSGIKPAIRVKSVVHVHVRRRKVNVNVR